MFSSCLRLSTRTLGRESHTSKCNLMQIKKGNLFWEWGTFLWPGWSWQKYNFVCLIPGFCCIAWRTWMPACANSTPACLSSEASLQMFSLVFLRYKRRRRVENAVSNSQLIELYLAMRMCTTFSSGMADHPFVSRIWLWAFWQGTWCCHPETCLRGGGRGHRADFTYPLQSGKVSDRTVWVEIKVPH